MQTSADSLPLSPHRSAHGWAHRPARLLCAATVSLLLCAAPYAFGQVVGDEAEMDRLQARADELIANNDPEGAAMQMGRAALMAAHIAKRRGDAPAAQVYRAAEQLYRAQEHGYRAMALFQRAGGQPPASTGVCHTAQAAQTGVAHALNTLAMDAPTQDRLSPPERTLHTRLRASADDWTTVVASLISDFQCP